MSANHSATVASIPNLRPRLHATMKLSLQTIDNHGLIHASAAGSITAPDFPDDGKDPLEALLGENWKSQRVLLDLGGVTSIDSSAVGWLIGLQRAFKEGGGQLVVHSVQPPVLQILNVLKVERVVPLAENASAARALALGGGQ